MALVFIENSHSLTDLKMSPKKIRSAKVDKRYYCRVTDPQNCKLRNKKMFWPLNYHFKRRGNIRKNLFRNNKANWHTFSLRK